MINVHVRFLVRFRRYLVVCIISAHRQRRLLVATRWGTLLTLDWKSRKVVA